MRYSTNDSSYQALGDLLRHNTNGMLVYKDELMGLLKPLDREENSEARAFYLQGWNGDGNYTFDRIGRGANLHVPCAHPVGPWFDPAREDPRLRRWRCERVW